MNEKQIADSKADDMADPTSGIEPKNHGHFTFLPHQLCLPRSFWRQRIQRNSISSLLVNPSRQSSPSALVPVLHRPGRGSFPAQDLPQGILSVLPGLLLPSRRLVASNLGEQARQCFVTVVFRVHA